jgi:hypothetical protein
MINELVQYLHRPRLECHHLAITTQLPPVAIEIASPKHDPHDTNPTADATADAVALPGWAGRAVCAADVVPDVSRSEHWRDPDAFFRSGASGEWFECTTAADRQHYDARVAELVSADLARWVHEGGSSLLLGQD